MTLPRMALMGLGFILSASVSSFAQGLACPPVGMTKRQLLDLKQAKFEVASAEERSRLALALTGCLEDPDPAIRDGVAFEALFTWLRGKALPKDTVLALQSSLSTVLAGPKDAAGFRLPFAALALSEVARVDRIEATFSEPALKALVDLAASSLTRVDDYRGFDNTAGWRHGAAHGADLVLQLALNPRVDAAGLRRLADAVATQVAPRGEVFYSFGEPERLARALVFTYRRGLLDAAFWDSWFVEVTNPKPMPEWRIAFQSVEGLAKRHNTLAFLHAISYAARTSNEENLKPLAALADKAVAKLGS